MDTFQAMDIMQFTHMSTGTTFAIVFGSHGILFKIPHIAAEAIPDGPWKLVK